MTDFTISCETVARFSHVLRNMPDHANEWIRSIRIDGGVVVASNRHIMAIERIDNSAPGAVHIINAPEIIENCKKEAAFGGKLTVSVNALLGIAVAKTTFGYIYPGNAMVVSTAPNDLETWRARLPEAPVKKSHGAMFWNAPMIADLAASSPSGRVAFEEYIDIRQAAIMRDIVDDRWLGVFLPRTVNEPYLPAAIPEWLK